MAPSNKPRIRRTAQNVQYTYNLCSRVNAIQTYPVLSPQGATILLYGTETGLKIVWRGGRRFKTDVLEAALNAKEGKKKQNGSAPPDDAIMIIDSDEEDSSPPGKGATTLVDESHFEDITYDETEYPDIVQDLDLDLGSAVLQIATLPMAPCIADDAAWAGTDLLKEKMVFTVSCATREVYLFTLPLTPPSPFSKARDELKHSLLAGRAGHGLWDETKILLGGLEKPATSLAMSLVQQKAPSTKERGKSAERSVSGSRAETRAVVAAGTREARGVLRLWEVPLLSAVQQQPIASFQTEYLPSPLINISFNTTHSTQLLASFSGVSPAVRVYDYALPSMPGDDTSDGPFPSQGSWLLSLYPPFAKSGADSSVGLTRKPIIGAEWIAQGRAIFALLADGQWGIWDVDGVAPQGNSFGSGASLLSKAGSGIKGAALTSFSTTGFVEGTSPLRQPGAPRASSDRLSGNDFVPMTPHTRQSALSSLSNSPAVLSSVRGGLIVAPLPEKSAIIPDESVVMWLGSAEHIVVIPAILKFWDTQVRKSSGNGANLFSGAQPMRMTKLTDLGIGLGGESCRGVGAVVRLFGKQHADSLPVEVLVMGQRRVVIVRESEAGSGLGTKIGGVVGSRRISNRIGSSNGDERKAIIVQNRPGQSGTVSFNLSVRGSSLKSPSKPRGSVKDLFATSEGPHKDTMESVSEEQVMNTTTQSSRPASSGGFAFAESLAAAADLYDDDVAMGRDIEEEMLDIMEIDRALDNMDDDDSDSGRGRRRVLFDG